jgi:hypothetical protein
MRFIYDLMNGRFDFIIPMHSMILGIVLACVLYLFVFICFTRKKR